MNTNELDKIVLSYLVQHRDLISVAKSILKAEYFLPEYIKWFTTIMKFYDLYNQQLTLEVLTDSLQRAGSDHEKIVASTILFNELAGFQTNKENFPYYARQMQLRFYEKIEKVAVNDAAPYLLNDKNPIAAYRIFKKVVLEIEGNESRNQSREGFIHEDADLRWDEYLEKERNPVAGQGVMLGFDYLDNLTNGLKRGETLIITGLSGYGKSITLVVIGKNIYKQGKNVIHFSIENPKEQVNRRLESSLGDIDYKKLRDGKLIPSAKQLYKKVIEWEKRTAGKFYVVDLPKGCNAQMVEAKIKETENRLGIKWDLGIVDHISIMQPNVDTNSDWLNQGKVSEELHMVARDCEIPLVSAVQMTSKRGVRGATEGQGTHRVARSEMIPQNVDVCINIDDQEDPELSNVITYHIVKNRDANIGSFQMLKNFDHMQVLNKPIYQPINPYNYDEGKEMLKDQDIDKEKNKLLE
jgi:replicative DNA helicase